MNDYQQDLVRIIVGLLIRAGKEEVVFTPEDLDYMEVKFPEHSLVVEVEDGYMRAVMLREGDKLAPFPGISENKIPNVH
jgi:hypothetical protein